MDRVIKKKKWTTTRRVGLAALLVLALFALYRLVLANSAVLKVDKDRLQTATVKRGAFQEFISIEGTVQPIKTYYLDIIENGVVEKIFVEDGIKVIPGDTLLKLSNTALQLDYLNRETRLLDLMNESQTVDMNMRQNEILSQQQLAESAYRLKLAQRIYQRNAQLIESKMVSQEEFLNTKDDYEYQKERLGLSEKSLRQDTQLRRQRIQQLNGSIKRMENQLELSRNTLNNLYMLAPAEGQLSAFRAEIGEAKQVGDNIGQIDDLRGFKIRARIDQHYISKVYTGLQAHVEFGGKAYKLQVKKIYPEVNQGEFQVDLGFVNGRPKRIRRGQSLQIRLELSDTSESLLIPKGSFYNKTAGNWIFVWDPQEKRARKRMIKIGRQNPAYFEVKEGLKVGEKVIISSYQDYESIEMIQAK